MKINGRKAFLMGTGATLALPYLPSLSKLYADKKQEPQKRFCAIFFPYGVSLPYWFPEGDGGKDYKLSQSLQPLKDFRSEMTVLSGLSHPFYRKITTGHRNGGVFLNGADIITGDNNSISLDQLIAKHNSTHTRFSSLTLSSGGGVGSPLSPTSFSVDQFGKFIPAMSKPRLIFNKLFSVEKDVASQIKRKKSVLDFTMNSSNNLLHKLNSEDRHVFEEYRQSIRELEIKLIRAEKWASIPKPGVPENSIDQNSDPKIDAQSYLDSMFTLMYLALKTNSTSVICYQIASEGLCVGDNFPKRILGLGSHHGLSHSGKGGLKSWAKYDQYLVEQFRKFITKLRDSPEGEGSLLDYTINLFGTGSSVVHIHTNYPLILAGGTKLGLKHGKYLKYKNELPMNNLLLSLAHRYDIQTSSFGDSTGELTDIV